MLFNLFNLFFLIKHANHQMHLVGKHFLQNNPYFDMNCIFMRYFVAEYFIFSFSISSIYWEDSWYIVYMEKRTRCSQEYQIQNSKGGMEEDRSVHPIGFILFRHFGGEFPFLLFVNKTWYLDFYLSFYPALVLPDIH